MRRVVITGLGTVNPLGNDVETSFQHMLEGRSGVARITKFDTSEHAAKIAASVDIDLAALFSPPDQRKLDPFTMFALVAAREAVADAGNPFADASEEERERFGSIIATGIGGITGIEEQFMVLQERGPRRVSPHFIPRIMANANDGCGQFECSCSVVVLPSGSIETSRLPATTVWNSNALDAPSNAAARSTAVSMPRYTRVRPARARARGRQK
jgi:3-oxoacyl-(acyl-carrier-protein) synthase